MRRREEQRQEQGREEDVGRQEWMMKLNYGSVLSLEEAFKSPDFSNEWLSAYSLCHWLLWVQVPKHLSITKVDV